jgi:hypothetical protein
MIIFKNNLSIPTIRLKIITKNFLNIIVYLIATIQSYDKINLPFSYLR